MSDAPVEPQGWPPGRRWGTVAFIVVLQVGLIFWFSRKEAVSSPSRPRAPAIYLPREQSANLPLMDYPALFALPGPHGFSSEAWLRFSPLAYQSPAWTEPPAFLKLPVEQLGGALDQFV